MKIAVVPDNHLNKVTYKSIMDSEFSDVSFRSADFMRSFRWIVDTCINEIKPDMFVIPGDVYDYFDPSNAVRGFFSGQISRLTGANINVIILIGNHDVCRKHHALKDIQELNLPKVRVVDRPKIFTIPKANMQFFMFPYTLQVEQKILTIRQEFEAFLKEIEEKKVKGMTSIFFGHFGVRGGKLNEYKEENELLSEFTDITSTPITITKEFVNTNPNDISAEDLDKIGADYVLLGDFHEFQILPTKHCFALYAGSIEKTDFSEINHKKGFILFDSEGVKDKQLGFCKFIEYPHCRDMIEFRGNFKQIKEQFEKLDYSSYKNPIIKINFEGTNEEKLTFSVELEQFKKEVKRVLDPVHIYHVQKIKNSKWENQLSKIEREILDKEHLEAKDVLIVVKEIIDERVDNEEERKKTFDLATAIYGEINANIRS